MDTQALHSYARRIASVLDEIDALKQDIKEIEAEARTVCNCNVKVLRKWITAERKDKIADVVCEIGDLTEYGAILGHMETFQGVRDEEPPQIEAVPDHDPDTGEINESRGESREREKPAEQVSNPEAPLMDETRKGPSGTAAPLTMPDIPDCLRRA